MSGFGFSVGDLITAIQIANRVRQALNEATGSVSEFNSLLRTLDSLQQALVTSEAIHLQWKNVHPTYKQFVATTVEAMIAERQRCLDSMTSFLARVESFKTEFRREKRSLLRRNYRKVKWTFWKEDVQKLERDLQLHLKILQIHTDNLFQHNMASGLEIVQTEMASIRVQLEGSIIPKSLGYLWTTSPTLEENVLLLDANGRTTLLPMLFLTSPTHFHDILKIMYRGLPGSQMIRRRSYSITDEDSDGTIIDLSQWEKNIHPGKRIALNMVIEASPSWTTDRCPKCDASILGPTLAGKRKRCSACQLTFHVLDRERIVEDVDTPNPPENQSPPPEKEASNGQNSSRTPGSSLERQNQPNSLAKHRVLDTMHFTRIEFHREILRKKKEVKVTSIEPLKDEAVQPISDPSSSIVELPKELNIEALPPLHNATARGSVEDIMALLEKGKNINATQPVRYAIACPGLQAEWTEYFEDCTPLHIAAWFGNRKVVELLLSRGANILAKDRDGESALVYAIEGRGQSLVPLLIKAGADPNVRSSSGNTVLFAAACQANAFLLDLLLTCDMDLTIQDSVGNTVLHYACECGYVAIVEKLLEYDADISIQNTRGSTPLHIAVIYGRGAVVECLLLNGADHMVLDGDGLTPLVIAAFQGLTDCAEPLIKLGGIEAHNEYGNRPIHLASIGGHTQIVQALIQAGANLESQNALLNRSLHLAVWNRHVESAMALINAGADRHAKGQDGCSMLHLACHNGCTELAMTLMEAKAVTETQGDGNTPLHMCCWTSHIEMVMPLINAGANIEATNINSNTGLHLAAWNGHMEIVMTLVEAGANIEASTERGDTAICLAAFRGHADIVRVLSTAKAKIDVQNCDGDGPIHQALLKNHTEVLQTLIECGANIELEDNSHVRPLHIASYDGSVENFMALLNAGAKIEVLNGHGNRCLHLACWGGHLDIVEALIKAGVDLEARDQDGDTAIISALVCGHTDIVLALIEAGADLDTTNMNGDKLLHIVSKDDNLEITMALITAGANLESKNKRGSTPLSVACAKGRTKIAIALIDAGAKVEAQDDSGDQPLHLTASGNHIEITKALIEAKAEVDARSDIGNTPLLWAAREGHMKILQILMQNGAGIRAENNFGTTSVHHAVRGGNISIVQLFLDAGLDVNARAFNQESLNSRQESSEELEASTSPPSDIEKPEKEVGFGETPLYWAVLEGKEDHVRLLLQYGADPRIRHQYGRAPLDIARKYKFPNIASLLIERLQQLEDKDSADQD